MSQRAGRASSRTEWLTQVRFEGELWVPSGRSDHEPDVTELRSRAWSVMGARTKGSPDPIAVRSVTVTYSPNPAVPFREDAR